MYRGVPNVNWYARKVRHAKMGVRARACPILASLGTILPENPWCLGIGKTWYDGRHQSWGHEPTLGCCALQNGTL